MEISKMKIALKNFLFVIEFLFKLLLRTSLETKKKKLQKEEVIIINHFLVLLLNVHIFNKTTTCRVWKWKGERGIRKIRAHYNNPNTISFINFDHIFQYNVIVDEHACRHWYINGNEKILLVNRINLKPFHDSSFWKGSLIQLSLDSDW